MDHVLLSTKVVMLPSQHLVKQPLGYYPMEHSLLATFCLTYSFFFLWLLVVVVCVMACV